MICLHYDELAGAKAIALSVRPCEDAPARWNSLRRHEEYTIRRHADSQPAAAAANIDAPEPPPPPPNTTSAVSDAANTPIDKSCQP